MNVHKKLASINPEDIDAVMLRVCCNVNMSL